MKEVWVKPEVINYGSIEKLTQVGPEEIIRVNELLILLQERGLMSSSTGMMPN